MLVVRNFIWYIFSCFCFFTWENHNIGDVDIKTDLLSRILLQVDISVHETWLIKEIVYLQVVYILINILAVDKL